MSRTIHRMSALVLLVLLTVTVGCSNNKEGMETANQDADRIADLESQIAMLQQQRVNDQEQIRKLMAERDQLMGELATANKEQPAPGWQSVPGGAMISIEGTVLFDSGKADLRGSGRSTLADVAKVLKQQYPNHDVYIFGHTDKQPIRVSGWKDNYELSCQRALAVLRQLRTQGVSNNMAAGGWGDQLPVATGTGEAALQKNRRVEIYAMRPFAEIVKQAK